eukprot:CAMPEP_0180581428 /NCGR_PEP_ID=MMETSP1037_2-20121125/14046_1 /TAXON_ID=632150 /ORGANISM="Azadinium spinosum, Strain 3D9" /LENGTH=102 /DNA_ID=CAMNT_0022599409 /DNA_START=153 /DNA_END=458 /DNA_ORIENTATION=+
MSLILIFMFCASIQFAFKHPLASRILVGLWGLCVVIFAILTSFGIFFLCGKYLNEPMMLAMPLLALGLGVDDMFVVLRYFSDLGIELIDQHSNGEIIGEVMA